MEQKLRAPRMSIWLLAILAALVASAHASAINLDRSTYKGCVQRCSKDNSLFSQDSSSSGLTGLFRKSRATGQEQSSVQFELGKTYSYRVNTWNEARTIYALNEQQNTRDQLVRVQATALLTPVSDCELSLQLQNIKLNLKDGQSIEGQSDVDEFIRQLEVPILFGYQNGVVSEVCTDSNEESSALNIKKSIISAFQTTPNLSNTEQFKVIEPDFNGECETEYSVEKMSWNKFLVTKRKDLNKCDNPAEQVETYRNWKNTLLKHNTNSVAQCTQTIQGQQIQSAQCQSVRTINTVLPHFTVQLVSNVVIESNEVLSAEQQSAQVPARWTRHAHRLMMAQPSTGIFSQKRRSNKRLSELADGRVQLKNVLDQICDDIQTNGQRVSLKTAQYVHILADTLKQSSQEDVHFVWQNIVQNHNICGAQAKKLKDIFVDTAASVMNRNSALIVRDELVKYIEKAQQEKDQFSLKKARYLATLVAFSFEPTAEAVRQIVPELLEKVNDAQIVLSLSALVKKTREELNDAQLLESLYQTVLRKVLARYSHDQETEIVRLLNALENIEPQTVVSGQEQLVKLTSDKRLFESIRVAAIKSVQHIEMQAQLRQTLVKIFTDRSESNEIRIAAYRSLVQSQTTVQELRQILAVTQQEQNDDVRNYVFSHQKNLRTTNDLKKRALLPLDAPLFPEPQSIANFLVSRNFEYSFVNPRTEAGAIVEADLIMENDSRVPRAVTFNLTVPVAEQQIPIVELTIRQQGLERSLIERLEKLKQLKSPAAMLREVRRMVQSQKVRQQPQDDQQGKLQMLINVDGKNVYVWDSVECQKEQQNDQFDTILAQLYKQLPIQIDETMVMMPLKHRVRLPTSNGIPINFELNTTLIASLETTIKGHQGAENLLEMHIKPTLVAELGVGLEADLQFEGKKAQRVQFLNRFITAPTFHVKLQEKPQTRQLRVKVLMPENEQIVARFETQLTNDEDNEVLLLNSLAETGLQSEIRKAILREQRQPHWYHQTNQVHERQCLPVLDQVLGFTYCIREFSVDDLKAAFATKQSAKTIYLSEVKLVKTDLQMEGIEFGMELPELFTPESTVDELKFVFHFDTPNSKVNRRINTELVVRIPQQQTDKFLVQVDIDSPLKKISGQVVVLNQEKQKGIKIELTTDRQQRQFLLEANALVAVQDATNSQVKVQLRVQPTAQSKLTQLEGEFVVNAQSETKKKVQLRLLANEQQVLDVEFVKAGSLLQPVDLKMSTSFKLNLLGAEIESSALLNKNQQTGTIKSTGTLKYNRFLTFSRRGRSTFESIDYQLQYSGFNQPIAEQQNVKKFVHWTLQSSQFPRINQELTYNIKGQVPNEFSQELNFKWSTEEEGKRVHIVHESKQLQNARTRNVKLQSQLEVEITPLNLHYDVQMIVDQQQQSPKTIVVELKAANRKTSQVALEARLAYVLASQSPLRMETQGEIKIRGGKHVFLYRDNVQEVSQGVFQGKTLIEMPESSKITRSMPKKIQLNYTYKQLAVPASRLPEIQGRLVQNLIAKLVNSLEQFEHELTVETNAFGQIQHTGLVAINEQNEWQLKSHLQREQQSVFKTEAEIVPRQRALKIKFESDKLNQLQVQLEAQLKGEQKKVELKVEDQRMKHQTRVQMDKQEQKFELACQTIQNQQTVFELNAKRQDKSAQLKINSRLVEAEIELNNLSPRIVQSMLKKRSFDAQQEQSQAKISFKLPAQELEHMTEIKIKPAQRQVILASETRKEGRNLLKGQINWQPEEKSIVSEYKNGYIANVKLTKNAQEQVYEFVADYQIVPKQWIHKTVAKWQFNQQSQDRRGAWTVAPQFRLITLDVKNHLGQRNVFDLTYRCNEQNPQAEFAHQFIVSTRDTHAELHSSRLAFDNQQQSQQPKVLFTLKTKKFGGLEHKTELKQIDLQRRQLKLFSNTLREGEVIAQVECELALQRGQQSQVKIQLLNGHQIDVQFVPFQWFEAQGDYRNQWKHQIRFDRKASQQQWSVKAESLNKRNNQKWNIQSEHQCDQFTSLQLDTPIVRGNVEVRFDSNKIHIDLKGDQQWEGLEHKTDAQLDIDADKLVIKSVTLRQGKPFVFVDAELYATLNRASTLKVEVEPLEFKSYIQANPKVGGELQITARQWKHQTQIKKRSSELIVQSETRKDGEIVVLVDTELSPKKAQLKAELGLKRFSPISVKGKIDLEDREMQLQAHNKRSDRLVKMEAKVKDLKNVHLEVQWDAARDQSKQVLVQVRVQDKQTDPERFVASIRGDIIDRPFEVKIDVPRTLDQAIRGSHNIEVELKNRKTNDQYIVKVTRKYSQAQQSCQSWIEVRKNDFTYIKTDLKLDFEQEKKKLVQFKVESDLKVDILNVEIEMTRECVYKQCQSKAVAVYGAVEKKQIKFEGSNMADAVRGQIVIDLPRSREQTIKFEFIKPESKLQINVFNQAGRQLDLNVDLARPLQKKFQVVSFVESIPTVDIEIAHGENSRMVIEVSFQQEKKMELSINWFGQWRRDFKLEALLKCFSKPSIEMLITSRHPAGVDEIDGMLKVASKEYVAKWVRKFDESKKNWNTKTLIQVNGEKKVDLQVELVTKQLEEDREVMSFKAHLTGVKQATGLLTVAIRKQESNPLGMIEMVQWELGNQQHERVVSFDLFLGVRDVQQSAIRTGVKLAAQDKTIFGLTHFTNDRVNGQNKRTSMIRLELPDQIEYVLRNEIEYQQNRPEQIKSIRSELKRKQNSVQPIYQTRIIFGEDKQRDLKVMRVEIHSDRFTSSSSGGVRSPKIVEIRYNFAPKQCKTLELQQQQQRTFSFGGQTKCWRFEVLAGQAQNQQQRQQNSQQDQFELQSEQQFDIKIGAEYIKYPIDARHSNRTIRFTIESAQKQNELSQTDLLQPINFTLIGHASVRSIGMEWDNHNRHGQHKSGMVYLDAKPIESGRSMVNMYLRDQNRRQPSKDFVYDLHFIPQEIRKSVRMSGKMDQEKMRKWIVGELPKLEEMAREKNMREMRSKMMREIREEISHKMAYLKNNYNDELVQPMMDEAREVQRQMKDSEDKIAREVSKMVKRAAEKVEEVYESVDVEEVVTDFADTVLESVEQWKNEAWESIANQCHQNKACRELVNQIRDYEIEQFVDKHVVQQWQKINKQLKRAVPEEVLESVKELAKQFKKAHDDDEDEYECEEEQQDQQKKRTSKRWMKHTARLLKMSQPEISENMIIHFNRLSKPFTKQQDSQQQDQQQQQIDWHEVRGALHDMTMDLIDHMQEKTTKGIDQLKDQANKNMEQAKPFWNKYFGGNSSGSQQQQGSMGDYSKFASQYQQQWAPKNSQQDQDESSNKSNFVFSPKRGEFNLGTTSGQTTSSFWSRA